MSPVSAASAASTKVSYITTQIVRPATLTEPPTPRLELTPWDLQLIAVPPVQKGLLFRHKPSEDCAWITQLKVSLSSTLDHFYPLAGRLATESHTDNTTLSIFIQCNNAGAEFVHAKADLTVSDVVETVYVPRFVLDDFFLQNGAINYDGQFQPLLAVQVTELTDGIFIGCTMNHILADGETFWHFMNTWSEMCRTGSSEEILVAPPNFNRWFLNETDLPVQLPISTINSTIRRNGTLPAIEERFFHFAPQNIEKLKAIANTEVKKTRTTKMTISSLQAVLGHLWQAAARGKSLGPDELFHFMLVIGNRGSRLNDPPLPERYFGNSFNLGFTTAIVGQLHDQGLGHAAGLLNELVNSYNHAKNCIAWKDWVKSPAFSPPCFDQPAFNILFIGSSPRFNVYGNDFGWGCPIAVRSGWASKFDGSVTVYPGAMKGSIDVEACLSPDTLRAMGDDLEFMEVVGVVGSEN